MYSIIEIGGLQEKVAPGDKLKVPYLKAEVGARVTIDKVLLVNNDKDIKVGNPTIKGATVIAQIISHGKAPKVIIFKKERRKRFQKKVGHRQPITEIEILEVDGQKAKPKKTEKKAAKKKAVAKPDQQKTAKKSETK